MMVPDHWKQHTVMISFSKLKLLILLGSFLFEYAKANDFNNEHLRSPEVLKCLEKCKDDKCTTVYHCYEGIETGASVSEGTEGDFETSLSEETLECLEFCNLSERKCMSVTHCFSIDVNDDVGETNETIDEISYQKEEEAINKAGISQKEIMDTYHTCLIYFAKYEYDKFEKCIKPLLSFHEVREQRPIKKYFEEAQESHEIEEEDDEEEELPMRHIFDGQSGLKQEEVNAVEFVNKMQHCLLQGTGESDLRNYVVKRAHIFNETADNVLVALIERNKHCLKSANLNDGLDDLRRKGKLA
ncbi:hypothetical protein QYM36_018862 [Artemia franciscana]|uniref:Uncharacterized protein n=1 Tax=Artemia franciscana TaxID=6661 RepID=A0AA88H881_ARTSF|nr:hypothetical protein QYM36_018862 [Artemia franciscana]